jgi:hypothetical protein
LPSIFIEESKDSEQSLQKKNNGSAWYPSDTDAFVKLSTIPYCAYISSQYNCTHYDDSTQYSNQYTSTDFTSLPLNGNSPCTRPSIVSAHNERQIDSAHFVISMPYDRHTSQSLVTICNDRPTDSI